ncbi:putative membrane protein [Desulfohalotomaculum tongense]|uniref:DUF1634 domain-containing protein n=1 Tax=Desulforadius tongensis TaxID=1216062 RepID=UPI00195B95A6|nr:DUF1634 domain-containing protein [Desulforadius tongensis]MBM7853996.1 putative membrane protein [Desulforadius tongensis]
MAKEQLAAQQAPKSSGKVQSKMHVPAEQVAYANMINYGQWLGVGILVITFFIYMSGMMPGFVPPSEVAQTWHLSCEEFLKTNGMPHGWEWLGMLRYGNFLSLLGIAWLAGLTIIAYLAFLVPAYLKQKDTPFLTIVAVEIIVLVLAASGILGSGGH